MFKHFGFFLLFYFSFTSLTAQYAVKDIPNPKEKGQNYFVSNPDRILSYEAESQLDALAAEIDSLSGAEFVVVAVDDYVGDSDFDFALDLFNTWGIGKKDSNNGLLLFIAKDRREYRFIPGYGMERLFPDAFLKRVGEKYLVPNFRKYDYDIGVIEAAAFVHQILTSPNSIAELESMMPEAIPFWSFKNVYFINSLYALFFFAILYCLTHLVSLGIFKGVKKKPKFFAPLLQGLILMSVLMFISVFVFAFGFKNFDEVYSRKNIIYFVLVLCSLILAMKLRDIRVLITKSFVDEEQKHKAYLKLITWLSIPLLLSPLEWFGLKKIFNRFAINKGRFTPPDDSGDWERIVRRNIRVGQQLLSEGQRKEEKLRSRKYEIWKNTITGKIQAVAWEINISFLECPSCHFHTFIRERAKVIKAATETSTGEGKIYQKCKNCNHTILLETYTIPKVLYVRRSSSSGRSSSSSSSGSRSSSSGSRGSFGGGSSGGGGAGGRW